MDGAFKAAPSMYEQVFTICGAVGQKALPFVYCILTDKTVDIYQNVFRHDLFYFLTI